MEFTFKGKVTRAAAVVAASALMAGASVMGGTPAGADPKQFNALAGVGSDTTQDVVNALAGFNNNVNYTPVQSSVASGKKQVISFDAVLSGSDCVTTRPGGASFLRPNGSTNGRRALSRAIDGTTWPAATPLCGGPKVVSGQVDFARSSAGPGSGSPLVLTYIPFGRDGLGFAYYASSGTPVTTLTSAQLTSLFSTGPQTIGGIEIVPCGIQTGSGTYNSWNTALGVAATEATGTATCNAAGTGQRLQENDANGLKAKGDAQPGKEVIVGFSAANFISQMNSVAASQLPVGQPPSVIVDMGAIDALGKPYTGTAPSLAPSASFYANTTYGRDVYNVVPTAKVTGIGNNDLKTMFVGATSSVCQATSTITAFGFSNATALPCGDTTTQGPSVVN